MLIFIIIKLVTYLSSDYVKHTSLIILRSVLPNFLHPFTEDRPPFFSPLGSLGFGCSAFSDKTSDKALIIFTLYIKVLYVFISRQAGHRFGEHIERVMPLLVRYSSKEDDELREYCLQACEAFVQRCPKEITPHINSVCTCNHEL